jgi:3-dehydroquinate dehydratase / shikimate dehydrogenase
LNPQASQSPKGSNSGPKPMANAILVATLVNSPSQVASELTSLSDTVEWVEVRADLSGDLDPFWLRGRYSGQLLYTLRSRQEGGSFEGPAGERRRRLLEAARHYDLVDLEGAHDLSPELLSAIPPHKRLISWQGAATDLSMLRAMFDRLSKVEARIYKLVVRAAQVGDELLPLSFLKSLGRTDCIAYTTGQTGFWSRIVAAHLGAPMIFGSLGRGRGATGEPTISQLIEDYGLPSLISFDKIYGIVGSPVFHSLSPRLHNAAYRALGHRALFVPFHVDSFDDFWRELVCCGKLETLGISIRGLTVASPHKEAAIGMAKVSTHMVRRAGATNLFLRNNGHWEADTTDPEGVVLAIAGRGIQIERREAAVIGCGGAGRAVAAALDQAGARVTMVNRGLERGHRAVELLGLPFVSLSGFSAEGFSIVVNATPVGRDDEQLPFDVNTLSKDAVVIDLVYGSRPTPLVSNALDRGLAAIDGREVLFVQVRRQFQLMTGREMPVDLAREILGYQAELVGTA